MAPATVKFTAIYIFPFLFDSRWKRTIFALLKNANISKNQTNKNSKNVTIPEMMKNIYTVVLDDRRLKVSENSDTVDISRKRVENILHEYLIISSLQDYLKSEKQ